MSIEASLVLAMILVLAACETTIDRSSGTGPSPPATAPSGSSEPTRAATASETPADTVTQGELVPAVIGIPPDPGPNRTYRIGPHDLLEIEVFQVAELSSQERVNEEGFIFMPLIGNVKVGGLTSRQAEQAIADRLGERYLQNPQVNLFVTEYASRRITVTGQVKSAGVFPLTGETTLMQAIAMAGGLDNVAKKEEVLVFRKQESGVVNAYVVDLGSIEEGKSTDPVVAADDRIVVPKSGSAVLIRNVGSVLTGWALRVPFL